MIGQMMNFQLTITSIMRHADRLYPDTEIVSHTEDNPRHRCTFKDLFRRTRQLANALGKLGLEEGDRIGTLAWNDYRHLELYYAISCSGQICHTVNPRLFPEQVEFIVNHADDKWLFTDVAFVPLLEKLQDKLPNVEGFVVLTDEANMPETSLRNVYCYETWIGGEPDTFEWPELDENLASSMCYTSGTTGDPKGVVYSHRSTVLHAMSAVMPNIMNLSSRETIMPIVPMFHVNAWGTAYSAAMSGAKLVFPGSKAGSGETLAALINEEQVTVSLGVPTVWLALVNYLDETGSRMDSLKRVVVGGAACPLSLMKSFEKYDVWMNAAWGMTEMSPVGSFNQLLPWMEEAADEVKDEYRLKAGRLIYGVEMKIVDDEDNELPWDGKVSGSLKVRGPWICNGYYRLDEKPALDDKGWFETGDVAAIDQYGYMQITDRTKDVIKSGGEWISSIDIENAAMAHPDVQEAAVIGVYSPRWSERPLLVVVRKDGAKPDPKDILSSLEGLVAKWWIPEACEFVDGIPHTATGKVSKKDLRDQFKDFTNAS